MKNAFVKTENATLFLTALVSLQDRGAEEACLMVVDGVPGLGKSEIIQWWATQQECIFLRAKKQWTPAWMMRELLGKLKVDPQYSFEKMYSQALEALAARSRQAERDEEVFAIVVDEVDHIVGSSRILESLRDLSDMLEIPVILVGMGRVRKALTRLPQIASRVGQYVEFNPASIRDVEKMAEGLCEVEINPDLIAFLHKVSDGLMREVKEGLKSIERYGLRNEGPVGLKEMNGQILLNDRRTGKAITVRA